MKLCDVCCNTDAEGKDEKLGLLNDSLTGFLPLHSGSKGCMYTLAIILAHSA